MEIDMVDWMRFTDYRRYEKTGRVIEWFWVCLRSWPAARLLHSPRRFTIEKSGDLNSLPRNHTYFHRLDLPPYEDHESLERKRDLKI